MPKGRKILVVDDEAMVRTLLVKFLTSEGHSVRVAASSKQALPIYKQYGPFDALLCDVWLGEDKGANGWSVAESIRALQPDIRVLMFTGRISVDAPSDGGHYMIIAKPFSPNSLRTALLSLW